MSVAPRAAPSMSERSRMLSRRGSGREEEELAVGAVVVMLSDKTEDQGAAAYRLPAGDGPQDDTTLISSAPAPKEQCFMAVLAPSCDIAMASLQSQPPGTYLLVKEEDAAITVYVKFRQAVRALTLVKGKEVKKTDDAVQLAKLRKKDLDVLMQTPVHNLRLTADAFFLVEHCWKRFLPQVQAVAFELCCEPHLDEETKLEDWLPSMIPPSSYSLGLMPEACGFYILATPGTDAESSSATVITVRQVEFDFNKFAITVADGTLKPSALLLATSFSAKRTFEPYFTFSAIRDNFLKPEHVMLKETSVNAMPSQQSSLQNCVDLSSNDKELTVLGAAEAACGAIMPHEPLPDSFLTVLHEMHALFVNTAARDGATPATKPALWSAQKMKLVGRIIPVLVELLIASAAFSESRSSADQLDSHAVAAELKKRQTLAQFARAMRFDILFMTTRSDDSELCSLTHQLCQLLGARIRLPAELVDCIRDLVALFPVFLRLFLRNQGLVTLWKNLHHNDHDKDAAPDSRAGKTFRSFRAFTSPTAVANALQKKSERKPLLFGLSRKPQTKSRKSLSLGTSLDSTPFLSSKALAFFRLSPLSVQVYLGTQLREGYFTCPDMWTQDAVLATIAFCSCTTQHFGDPTSVSAPVRSAGDHAGCARTRLRSSPKLMAYELLLQLALRFLHHKRSSSSWDRDVALLLRLEDLHQHLFTEILGIVRRRAEAQDVNTQDALDCELRVAVACVSALFRLERRRRLEVSSAVGEKRYLGFIHSFRAKVRELNERLQVEAGCDDSTEECEKEEGEGDALCLLALAEIFKWIPKAFLNEWIVLSLKELLQAVNELSKVLKQPPSSLTKQLQYVRTIRALLEVLALTLQRTSDPDLQTLLVRVLGLDSAAVTSLLHYVLSTPSLSLNGGRDAVCVQVHVLHFLTAFVALDVALPVRIEWDAKNRQPREDESANEDAEVIEQLKGELLMRLLGPRVVEDGEQPDQSLWGVLLELMFPGPGTDAVASFNVSSRMLGIAASFRALSEPLVALTASARGQFQLAEAFLHFQQALYTAEDASARIDYQHCVASHLRRVEEYCDRMLANAAGEEVTMVYRAVELNLRCLVVLATRRCQCPALQQAFDHVQVLSSILQRLRPQPPTHGGASARSQRENSGSLSTDEAGAVMPTLPPLKLPRQPSADALDAITKLALPAPHASAIAHSFLLAEPGLHALAVVFVATYVLVDPNLELDEGVCPRISVGDERNRPSEVLWLLQQHLAAVELDPRHLEALTVEMETLQGFVSTARLAAIRSLLRLLCPNRFDCSLYTTRGGGDGGHAREYIAKGAFSTVYRQRPALPRPEFVAVKVVEHQRRAGDLCAVSGLFNEVSVLSKLRGERAATQLVDFGNHHAEQSFEIFLEYCPCSLTEWRATITLEAPFRSCLLVLLRAFQEACECLTRIHQAGVCHLDIKGDNVLVRSRAGELTRKLLESDGEQEGDASGHEFKGWLCFADFGESKIVDNGRIPARTLTFSSLSSGAASPVQQPAKRAMPLTRTRGTEAIKSPEVLNIKGSEAGEVNVTLASDIWSLGCLLYELVTQELLFQNDDWAGLYAHLLVTQDQPVLRSDHVQKLTEALSPSSSEEEAMVKSVLKLCSSILAREPAQRPGLEAIAAQVHELIADVSALPVTASDEAFVESLYQIGEASPQESQRVASPLRPFINVAPSRPHVENRGMIVPVRFFWNLFLAAHVAKKSQVGPACMDVLATETFESKHEADFVHFVYVSWHEDSAPSDEAESARGFIQELHEDEHRTCFSLSPHLKASGEDLHLMQQHATHYFPVIQRRLREEAGNVLFVALGADEDDTKALQGVLTASLFFFLRSSLEISVFDLLGYFARDCAQFFVYPSSEFLQQLETFSSPTVEDTAAATMIHCQCGTSVFAVASSALRDALSSQQCTCRHRSRAKVCPCFHPFQVDHEDSQDLDDEAYHVDNMFMFDKLEQQLVLPMETRAQQKREIKWVSLDAASISRVDSQSTSSKEGNTDITTSPSSDRRLSRFGKLSRRPSRVGDSSSETKTATEPQELHEVLVRGLQHGKPLESDTSDVWELYECPLCRLPICAVSDTKAAVPLQHRPDTLPTQ